MVAFFWMRQIGSGRGWAVDLYGFYLAISTVLLFRIRWFLRDSLGFLFLEGLAPPDEFG